MEADMDMLEDPLGVRLVKRKTMRQTLSRKLRPRSLEIRQGRAAQPPPPLEEESSDDDADGDSDSSDDELDSPSPTTSGFPGPTLPSGAQASITDGASPTEALTSRPVAQDETSLRNQAQDPKMGIAFGAVGAASIVLCFGVGIWWLCRRSRKKRRSKQSIPSTFIPPIDPRYTQQASIPPDRGVPQRSPSSLMDELLTAAYDVENGSQQQYQQQTQSPQGYMDEKRYDPNQQLPILQPVPVVQPVVRESIASWVRRHNPLKLNPVSGRNSVYSTTSTIMPPDPSVPPVPPVPSLYQARGLTGNDDKQPLVPPPLVIPRVASSHYSAQDQSPLSVYARNSGSWFNRGVNQPQQPQIQPAFNPRAPSVAMTERTATTAYGSESTWASWGAGVSRPQAQQHQAPPQTPRKAWIEKCVKLGGWK